MTTARKSFTNDGSCSVQRAGQSKLVAMDSWILLALLIVLGLFLNKIIGAIPVSNSYKIRLPPGPPSIPIIGSTLWFTHCLLNFQTILHRLFAEYGPVVAIRLPFSGRPSIYISDRSLAHQALVQRGSALANRFLSSTFVLRHAIGGTPYGPRYRILRRNLASSVMQPSKLASFGAARELALHDLIRRLGDRTNAGGAVRVRDCLRSAVNRLHVLMCFGEKLDDKLMDEVEQLQNELIRSVMSIESGSFRAVASKFLRGLTRTKLNKHEELQKKLEEMLIPVMTERRERVERGECSLPLHSYVDSLQQLEVPDEDGSARRLTEEEKLYFCCEFLMGTDSTITELEWIMANIIKNQDIQAKLWQEIEGTMAEKKAECEILKEEEVEKMPYLKAVILEGLRRHPPNLALIPRVAEEDIVLGDRYLIPKGSFVSVSIAEIGRGERAWDEPMQFRPERFLDSKGGGVVEHLMGSGKEARMIPFGLGVRVCPAAGMAELNLKFLVANLVRVFEWKANCEDGGGEVIDLSEEMMATAVVRVPLRARIISRISGVRLQN